jgi:acyl dehydratase
VVGIVVVLGAATIRADLPVGLGDRLRTWLDRSRPRAARHGGDARSCWYVVSKAHNVELCRDRHAADRDGWPLRRAAAGHGDADARTLLLELELRRAGLSGDPGYGAA